MTSAAAPASPVSHLLLCVRNDCDATASSSWNGAAQRLWGDGEFSIPAFHIRAKRHGRTAGNDQRNTWLPGKAPWRTVKPRQTPSSGSQAADFSGVRSGRSRSQDGWRSMPDRVRTL
ncbi:hypothetical protein GCM10010321_54760 [Streptomyces chartreusis]|nr:hypothetical protein GCM10010321_54760 [Streptomyces chartreusis]